MAKPDLPRGYLGAQPKFGEFKLSTLSHNEPEITASTNEVEIKFRMGQKVKVTGNLIQVANTKDLSDHIFTQTHEDVVSFLVTMPATGYYKLQVYALPVTDDSKTLPGVYNYLINCTEVRKSVCPYPKQYAQWKEGCYLYEPLTLENSNCSAGFKAFIPRAKSVAVTVNETWTQLSNKGGDTWEGNVAIAANARVTLNANYGGDESKYSTLLEYNL
ncbi:hypothetical protein FSP39_021272 [Pinctada imbricata]|uniref:KY-like immunoglobulin-like domain-containing protein n=1 Tax=Pinctada imbricata TaxID=66713 RepID=A0AA88Y5P8_PINIB|nr:hypothetical protein FSP39_021272 [Pinctada imbricata]